MEESHDLPEKKPEEKQFRGLYRHVHISVKALDWIIVACIAVIFIVLVIDLGSPGHTVTFDTRGGSDVPPQKQMYGELLEQPEPPTREGYRFTGWYVDYACDTPWNYETDTIQGETTLYAGWQKK